MRDGKVGKQSPLRYSKPLLSLTWTTAWPILASPPPTILRPPGFLSPSTCQALPTTGLRLCCSFYLACPFPRSYTTFTTVLCHCKHPLFRGFPWPPHRKHHVHHPGASIPSSHTVLPSSCIIGLRTVWSYFSAFVFYLPVLEFFF